LPASPAFLLVFIGVLIEHKWEIIYDFTTYKRVKIDIFSLSYAIKMYFRET
jgi:hypothetical protein